MDIKIIPISAFKDNYIWLISIPNTQQVVIVDPGDAVPVLKFLQQHHLNLAGILITHHHWDHSNGIQELLSYYQVPVFGSANETVAGVDHLVQQGDRVAFSELGLAFQVLDIPAHTKGHIAYYGHGIVFTGDTLFTGGCGRLFEGTAEQMVQSLKKLSALPETTQVYCGHEYTENNLRFALTVEPKNQDIQRRMENTKQLRAQNLPTVPSTIHEEKLTNPFLRCVIPAVIQAAAKHAGHVLETPVAVFTTLREWKNNFV